MKDLHDMDKKTGAPASLSPRTSTNHPEERRAAGQVRSSTTATSPTTIFGFKTLERSYLPCGSTGRWWNARNTMLMRVAVGIHGTTSRRPSEPQRPEPRAGLSTPRPRSSTPAHRKPQDVVSCFLLNMRRTASAAFTKPSPAAPRSQSAGGIGRSVGTTCAPRAATSKAPAAPATASCPCCACSTTPRVTWTRVAESAKGSFAVYLEPWHADGRRVLDLKKNHGRRRCAPATFLRHVDAGPVHEARGAERGLDPVVPQRVRPARHPAASSRSLREVQEGQGPQDHEGPGPLVPSWKPDRDRHAIYILFKGRRQRQEQPAEPGHHQELQPLHGDHGVHQPR